MKKFSYLLSLILLLFLQSCVIYDVPKPENSTNSIQVRKNILTDVLTVEDTKADRYLFSYYDTPSIQPISIQKLDEDHWVVVLEKPKAKAGKTVTLEQTGENDFSLSLKEK